MKNVGIYYRVSTDRQDLASQRHAVEQWLENLATDKKPASILEFKDEGISGKTNRRPGFQSLLRAAYEQQIDTIIAYRLDRISRNATDAIQTLLSLDQAGVAFISITQPVLNLGHDNPFRRTMLAAFSEIAEIERETIVSRVKSGIDSAKKRGIRLGRPRKFDHKQQIEVRELRAKGLTFLEISTITGISHGAVQTLVKGPDIEKLRE